MNNLSLVEQDLIFEINKERMLKRNSDTDQIITIANTASIVSLRVKLLENQSKLNEVVPVLASIEHAREGVNSADILRLMEEILKNPNCTVERELMRGKYQYYLNIPPEIVRMIESIYTLHPTDVFGFIRRFEVEYDPGAIQISSVANVYIEGKGFVMLDTNTGPNTLVQGHTNVLLDEAFTDSDEITFRELVEANIKQEIKEEALSNVDVHSMRNIHLKPRAIVRSYHDLLSEGHLGIFYDVIIDSPMNINVSTNEDSHIPKLVRTLDHIDDSDQWLDICRYILNGRVREDYLSFSGRKNEILEYLKINY